MGSLTSRLYGPCLIFYRRFFKRFRLIHTMAYSLGNVVVGLVSRAIGFQTNRADPLYWRIALLTGSHESATRRLLPGLIRPGMTVVDVGAHIGYYTTRFSKLVGPSGRVIAFEPHPRNAEILERNVGARSNVTIRNNAASDRRETLTLFDDMPDTGGPSLRRDAGRADQVRSLSSARELAPRAVTSQAGAQYEVVAVRIDEELASLGITDVDFVKMDIEGAEMGALLGMEGILKKGGVLSIVFELYPAAMKPFDVEPLAPWQWLADRGFHISRIGEDGALAPLPDEAAARKLIAALEQSGSEANLLARRD